MIRTTWFKTGILATILGAASTDVAAEEPKSVYELTAQSIDNETVPLSNYRGKVALIVNTASKCGFTGQYEALEALHKRFADQGFVVLGFPSNDFLGQEPGTNDDIKKFCKLNYDVSFPMFSKAPVTGKEKQPVFKRLTEESPSDLQGEVRWNFEKFLVDKNGQVVGRWRSMTSPESTKIVSKIEELLSTK